MNTGKLRLVRVIWEGPLSLSKCLERRDEKLDYGVYQVCGLHPVFGAGSLLYLGMARDQTFGARFTQHQDWVECELDVSIFLGRLNPADYKQDTNWKDWKQLLPSVEALLINYHTPPYNSRNISSYSGSQLLIQNWGCRGRLVLECSSNWRPVRPQDWAAVTQPVGPPGDGDGTVV